VKIVSLISQKKKKKCHFCSKYSWYSMYRYSLYQSCVCQLGTQGRNYSIKFGESYIQPNISSDRIVNGESAKNSWCGGSLIDSWNVLTSAHCTSDRDMDEFIL
jgi:hypothetical protein